MEDPEVSSAAICGKDIPGRRNSRTKPPRWGLPLISEELRGTRAAELRGTGRGRK